MQETIIVDRNNISITLFYLHENLPCAAIKTYLYSKISFICFLGLAGGCSSAYPKAMAPTSCPSLPIHSINSLYAKHVFAIHRVPNPNSVAFSKISLY